MTKSTRLADRRKGTHGKPHPDFPLTPQRGTGRRCKKVRGKIHYFDKSFASRMTCWQYASSACLRGTLCLMREIERIARCASEHPDVPAYGVIC